MTRSPSDAPETVMYAHTPSPSGSNGAKGPAEGVQYVRADIVERQIAALQAEIKDLRARLKLLDFSVMYGVSCDGR